VYNTAEDRVDFDSAQSSVDQDLWIRSLYGLMGNFQLKWCIDFDLTIDTLTQGASGTSNDFFHVLTTSASGMDASCVGFGLRLVVSSTELEWNLIFCENQSPLNNAAIRATFTTTPTVATHYFRMGMKSKDTVSIQLYSDAARTSLTEEETFDVSTIALAQTFTSCNFAWYIAMDDSDVADSTINGSIANVVVYAEGVDNVVSADTGSDTDLTDMSHVEGQV
jgi:hypothetical protein